MVRTILTPNQKPVPSSSKKSKSAEKGLPQDVFRRIVSFSTDSSSLLALNNLNNEARRLVKDETSRISRKNPIEIDIHQLLREKNPFLDVFYDVNDRKHAKMLHDAIRELCYLLEKMQNINEQFQIVNLTSNGLGFIAEFDESHLPRAPFMLQKKLMVILKKFQSHSASVGTCFMRPSRFIKTFVDRLDSITSLDLGSVKHLASMKLRSKVFPGLINLETLHWHHAHLPFMHRLKNRANMVHLDLTAHLIGQPDSRHIYNQLCEFRSLQKLYFGFTVPSVPSRMHMEVLLNTYQAIWRHKDDEKSILIRELSELTEIGFWNAPERIFIEMARNADQLKLKTLNFGQISQDLRRLCSIDSVMQAFFKLEEARNVPLPICIENLNLNLHTMPAVYLEYYLPNLMDHINRNIVTKSLTMFLKCIHHNEMTSSWVIEPKKRRVPVKSTYTSFELHCNGLCGLIDLDRQLPVTLEKCTISLNLPDDDDQSMNCVQSVVEFIAKLSNEDHFPDLSELHLQIWGVRCMELIAEAVVEHMGKFLKKLTLIAAPTSWDPVDTAKLLRYLSQGMVKCEEFAFSHEFLRVLMTKDDQKSPQWRGKIANLAGLHGFNMEKCRVTTAKLPNSPYIVKPEFGPEYRFLAEETDDDVDMEELDDEEGEEGIDSFLVEGEEEEYEEEDDTLYELEMKLEKETERREKKYRKKMEEKEDVEVVEVDEDEDDDVIDWDKLDDEEEEEDEEGNSMLDDMAEESDREESEDEVEIYEDVGDEEDEILIANGPRKRKNVNEAPPKRRKIVISDSDDE